MEALGSDTFMSTSGAGTVWNVEVEQGSLMMISKLEVILCASTAAVSTNE